VPANMNTMEKHNIP